MLTDRSVRPLVLTAADHRFARTLMQFLLSVERHGEDRRSRLVIHDLGLSESDRRRLRKRFGWAELRPFDFADHPPHLGLDRGSYAWKPVLVREAARGHDGPLFWFDSGTVLKAPLDAALAQLQARGFWGLRSQRPLAEKCDPRVLDALAVPLELRHMREFAAGAVGFDLSGTLGRQLLDDWAEHALIADHILPPDCAPFHKHDQALLNCLLARAMSEGRLTGEAEDIDISSASPSRLLSTRNFVPAAYPLWTDPLLRASAALWKAGDRLYHRARHFDDTRLDGWRRRRADHFSVFLRELPGGAVTAVPGPRDGYYADPFLVRRDGRLWLFVEEFVYREDRGDLTVLELDAALRTIAARPVTFLPDFATLDSHASFPCVFELAGTAYMVPETHERRAIDLYVCEDWPARWRLVRRLVFGVDAADSMLVHHGATWYLITSVQGGQPNRHLEIYFTDDLFSGRFMPHPINAKHLYGIDQHGTGRNAGSILQQPDGTLLRLMQASPNHYGEGIRPMRISLLTPQEFHEEPVEKIDFLPGINAGFPTHHATRAGDVIAYDTRDLVG